VTAHPGKPLPTAGAADAPDAPFLPSRFPEIPGLEIALHARVGHKHVVAGGEALDVLEVGGSFAVTTPMPDDPHEAVARSHVVGGDFADVFRIGDDYGIVYGDVSTKGPEAESLALMASCSVQSIAASGARPSAVMAELNRQVFATAHSDHLLALVYAFYEPALRRFRLCNCGCWPPVLVSGGRPRLIDSEGLLLGVAEELECEETDIVLGPGDMLVGCTDGISESRGPSSLFGDESFARVLAEHADSPAPIVASAIVRAAERFGPDVLSDDATVLVVRANP
jgi:serine phosphatase RsbU (regulator of sigma subunit)